MAEHFGMIKHRVNDSLKNKDMASFILRTNHSTKNADGKDQEMPKSDDRFISTFSTKYYNNCLILRGSFYNISF